MKVNESMESNVTTAVVFDWRLVLDGDEKNRIEFRRRVIYSISMEHKFCGIPVQMGHLL